MTDKKEKKIYLKVPAETIYLSSVRKVIVDISEKMGFPEEEVDKIEMAVDEAVTNVIQHSYTESKDIQSKGRYFSRREDDKGVERPIDLRVKIDSRKIEVALADRGRGFDLKSYEIPRIDERLASMRKGGLGVYVIKNFMDEVDYTHKRGLGNILRMVKYLPRKEDLNSKTKE